MFYTIYKITNLVNGKFYIGKHKTKKLDDKYFGSGKRLRYAILKYGIENFKKEILEVFLSEQEMNLAERILVVPDPEISYNLCPGGHGGFGFINNDQICINKRKIHNKNISHLGGKVAWKTRILTDQGRKKLSEASKNSKRFLGKHHSQETKELIGKKNSIAQKGSGNSQFGTMWITNGVENRKHKKQNEIPLGWYQGRKI